MPPVPYNTILRSPSGEPGKLGGREWNRRRGTNIRAITEWNGKLYVAAPIQSGGRRLRVRRSG